MDGCSDRGAQTSTAICRAATAGSATMWSCR